MVGGVVIFGNGIQYGFDYGLKQYLSVFPIRKAITVGTIVMDRSLHYATFAICDVESLSFIHETT